MRDLIEALITRGITDEAAALAEAGARHARVDLERLREILRLIRLVLGPYPEAEKAEAKEQLDAMADGSGLPPVAKPADAPPAEPAAEPEPKPAEAPKDASEESKADADTDQAKATKKVVVTVSEGVLIEKVVQRDGKWFVYSEDGSKKLGGPYDSEEEAKKRLRQIEFFKHRESDDSETILLEAVEPEGRIIDVLAIRSGTSRNRKRYRAEVLRDAVERHVFEGARSFASEGPDHDPARRGVRSLVGWWDNARFGSFELPRGGKAEGVAAYYHPTDPALRTTLVEAMRSGRPDLIGFSIYGDGPLARLPDGVLDVQRIDVIESIDPVIHPSAGGQALRLIASEEPMEPCKTCGSTVAGHVCTPSPDVQAIVEAAVAPLRTARLVEIALAEREGLPALTKARIRSLAESKPMSAAEVKALVEAEVDYVAKLAPAPKPADGGAVIIPGKDEADKLVEAAVELLTPGKPGSMRRFYEELTGDRSMTGRLQEGGRLSESAIVSTTFPQIMLDAMHKRMIQEYRLPALDDWQKIVSVRGSVSDFKTQNRIRWGGYGDLPAVLEGAAYVAQAEPGDEKATFTPSKRGGLEDLTLETLANDDMGQMRRIPQKLARAAKRTLYKFVFDTNLASNPTLYDTVALFAAGHANLGSTALSTATLETAIQAIRDQAEQGSSEPIGLRPKFLCVPTELEKTAYVILQTVKVVGSDYNDASWVATQGIQIIVNPFWTDANNWFVIADPADAETMEVAFWQGQEEPELFLQNEPTVGVNFSNDVLTYKIRHIYGGAVLDYRPFYGALVA